MELRLSQVSCGVRLFAAWILKNSTPPNLNQPWMK